MPRKAPTMPDVRDWRPVLGVLLGVSVLLGGTAALADLLQAERSYEIDRQPRAQAPEVEAWNPPPVRAPGQLSVYRLDPAEGSARQAVDLARELGMQPEEVVYDLSRGLHVVEASLATLHLEDRGRQLSYQRTSSPSGDVFEHPPSLPSDEEARRKARALLERTGLMPPEEDLAPEPRVIIDEGAHRCSSDDTAGQSGCRHVNLSKSVRYDRLLEGRPAIGANSLAVSFGGEGQLRELSVQWEPVQRVDDEPRISFEDALDQAKTGEDRWWRAPGECATAEVQEAQIGYFFPDRERVEAAEGPWVFPVYLFEGPCFDHEGEPVTDGRLQIAVPAVR